MLDNERPMFAKTVAYMFSLYPSASMSDTTVEAYWQHLKRFDIGPVRVAVQRAVNDSPKFPPTAPSIREIAEIEQRQAEARAKDPKPGAVAGYIQRASWEGVPRTDAGQQAYIEAGGGNYETLARLWECDAVRRGIKPNEPPPQEMGAAWFKQLGMMLEKSGPGSAAGRFVQDEFGKWIRDGGQRGAA